MTRNTFRVLFYLKRNVCKANGLMPIMCRITINGKACAFSCKLDAEERLWDVSLGKMLGRSIVAKEINNILEKIRFGIYNAYYDIKERDGYVSAQKVKNRFLGIDQFSKPLLSVFKQYNDEYRKQVGKVKSLRSYFKYCTVYKHLQEFIKHQYGVDDIALRDLSPSHIADFEFFLRVEKKHCTNTVWSYMMPFRSIVHKAINNGLLQTDPFCFYRIAKEDTKREYLSIEEIKMLINGSFKKKSYELIRDLFIFCCFTGLSWRDMYNLTPENLQVSFDGHLWIKCIRQKTGTETNIRLLDTATYIIDKYKNKVDDNKLLPVPCYANCRHGIKVIAKTCGIKKNVCWHQSRHSYATTICLSNGVPIETLSKLMGHTSIKTTQIYAKIVSQKISSDIEKLSKEIEPMEKLICSHI